MKAVRFHEHGGPEKLVYEDAPDPVIEEDEVLVRVRACALNHLDVWGRVGLPGVVIPLPHIPGSDIAGEVAKVGRLVRGVEPGERVIVSPGLSCGRCEFCLSGRDSLCREYVILGDRVDGGYAEYAKAPGVNILPMPSWMSFEEAASVPLVFLTAWHMLTGLVRVRPLDEVLVWGAGSGVGIASIQVAKLHGARVIATVGADWKAEKAREIGADIVLNHHREDVVERVRELTSRRGVDVVIDSVGRGTWERSLKSLAYGGKMISVGATTGVAVQVDIRYLYRRHLSILGSYMGGKAELIDVLRLFEGKRLRPVVDIVMPLQSAGEAQQRMEEGRHFGKIVLKP